VRIGHCESVGSQERKMEEDKVELSARKIEQLKKQPIIESVIIKSEDGEWIIHKTVITDIKPVSYFEKVLQG
jgi:hypothetical protein